VGVDQGVVVHDPGLVGLDEADPAHVGGQVIDVVHAGGRRQAALPAAQVQQVELARGRRLVLGELQVDAPDEVALVGEETGDVVADEAAGTRDQDGRLLPHGTSSRFARNARIS
jgi:hypothetical protein